MGENQKIMEDTTMDFFEMKDRIAHIIRAKNMTASEFADRLGIQPSNVSHLISGRNNPSLEFVKKLKETFPEYNLDWIVLGKGPMTLSDPFVENSPMMASLGRKENEFDHDDTSLEDMRFASTPVATTEELSSIPRNGFGLKQVIFVYEDRSFEILTPRK